MIDLFDIFIMVAVVLKLIPNLNSVLIFEIQFWNVQKINDFCLPQYLWGLSVLSSTGQRADELMGWPVVRLSVSNLQNQLLLKYQQQDIDETSQELSSHGPLLNLLLKFQFHAELWLPWQLKGKTLKIILSQTVTPRAQTLGMKYCLVDLYKVC